MNAPEGTVLLGRTIRWTCTDGPVAGQTFEHSFDNGRKAGVAPTGETFVAVVPVDDDIVVVSSLAAGGQALLATLNFADRRMVGFLLDHDSWTRQRARFELLPEPA